MNIREILNKLDTINSQISETTWQEIYDLNKDQIKNPNLIYPDQKLKMPGGGEYVVKPGDSLSKIAKTFVPAAPAKTEPAKSDTDKQIEKDKTNPQNTPAKPEPARADQSGQKAPVTTPPAKAEPTSNYDPDIAHDIDTVTGFNWGKRRSKADIDYSTGDIGFKPDGGAYTRNPFQKSTTAIPQTGGTFNSSGYDSNIGVDALDAIRAAAGLPTSGNATQSGQADTPAKPGTTPTPAATPGQPPVTPAQPPAKKERPVIGRPK